MGALLPGGDECVAVPAGAGAGEAAPRRSAGTAATPGVTLVPAGARREAVPGVRAGACLTAAGRWAAGAALRGGRPDSPAGAAGLEGVGMREEPPPCTSRVTDGCLAASAAGGPAAAALPATGARAPPAAAAVLLPADVGRAPALLAPVAGRAACLLGALTGAARAKLLVSIADEPG